MAEVFKQQVWLGAYGAPTAKSAWIWSNVADVAVLYKPLTAAKRKMLSGNEQPCTKKCLDSKGKKRCVGLPSLKQTQRWPHLPSRLTNQLCSDDGVGAAML